VFAGKVVFKDKPFPCVYSHDIATTPCNVGKLAAAEVMRWSVASAVYGPNVTYVYPSAYPGSDGSSAMRMPAKYRYNHAPIEVNAGWLWLFMPGPSKYSQFSHTFSVSTQFTV
jgi:hypothetical protein